MSKSKETIIANAGICITNKRICDFYNANKNINIESMNIILLDFIEQLGTDMTKILTNSALGDILSHIKEVKCSVSSITDSLAMRVHEYNKSFVESIKQLVENSSLKSHNDKVEMVNSITQTFVEKININIPKTHEDNNKHIQTIMDVFHKSIKSDITEFISATNSGTSIKDFLLGIDSKIITLQQPIYTFIGNSHEQISTKLNSIREEYNSNKSTNDKLMTDLGEFLNKYKSSSQYKGAVSENQLGTLLAKMFPTAHVENTTSMKACGDFFLKRMSKTPILIENKNYDANVNIDEIAKFLRDVNEHKINGIMMSQKSGIVSKPNGYIEINDGKVLVYLHNVEYSPDKIQMAIDVIDNLSDRLDEIINTDGNIYNVRKEVLDRINEQFNKFVNQRESITTMLRDSNKKLINMVEELEIPDLSIYLKDKYASIQNQQHPCDVCNLPFSSKRGLASHKKSHK